MFQSTGTIVEETEYSLRHLLPPLRLWVLPLNFVANLLEAVVHGLPVCLLVLVLLRYFALRLCIVSKNPASQHVETKTYQ